MLEVVVVVRVVAAGLDFDERAPVVPSAVMRCPLQRCRSQHC